MIGRNVGPKAGWFEDRQDPSRLRYWDGSSWTNHYAPRASVSPAAAASSSEGKVPSAHIPPEQIAHDLAIAYVSHRYGIRVTGEFTIDSYKDHATNCVDRVTGGGTVVTELLPALKDPVLQKVKTGERHLLGLGPEKTRLVPTGAYEIDSVFRAMISDYKEAYTRLLELVT